jgi:LysR family transcriptional regulator, regulator for genes of the gallate degradation pathway
MEPGRLPTLWQLKIFESVGRLENISAASAELRRSQPSITTAIVKLEKLLGATLFERSSTGTYPTAAATVFLRRTQQILDALERAVQDLGGLRGVSSLVTAMRITRAQARGLIAIEEAGSFRGAARSLGLSEASLHRAARQLERNFGRPIFRHTASGITTTAVGSELARRLRLIHGQVEVMVEEVHRHARPERCRIVVGTLLLDPTELLASTINELTRIHPGVSVEIVSGSYEALLKKLCSGSIDFMIGILKRPDRVANVTEEPLFRDHYCVVAGRNHPLVGRLSVTLDDLGSYDWILPHRSSPRRMAFEQLFDGQVPPTTSIETYSLSTIRIVLAGSDRLTLLTQSEMLGEKRIGLLAALPFSVLGDGPATGITMRKDFSPTAVQAKFLALLRREGRRLQNAPVPRAPSIPIPAASRRPGLRASGSTA